MTNLYLLWKLVFEVDILKATLKSNLQMIFLILLLRLAFAEAAAVQQELVHMTSQPFL